jgi:hypothetical protein
MLRCAVLRLSVGTALRRFRNPGLRSPLGRGAGPILIAGCGGKLSASFSKNACLLGYNIWLIVECIAINRDRLGLVFIPRSLEKKPRGIDGFGRSDNHRAAR